MRLHLKSRNVNPNISVEFAVALGWVKAKWEEWEMGQFMVTSLKDGVHGKNSKHKWNRPEDEPGEAADIRTWYHVIVHNDGRHGEKLIKFAKMLQSHGFGVVVHPDWLPGTSHLHFHLKKTIFTRSKS